MNAQRLSPEQLSPEQQYSFRKFQEKHNIFITGAGGTGKTKLIQTLVTDAYSRNAKIQVCALTGCAAILLNCGARTIHSWSGIRLGKGPKGPIIQSILRNKRLVKTWRQTQILIIDEVSMMSLKIFELLEETARVVRNNPAPFGGIQVIFTGDFFQLPPVATYGDPETEQFCFESARWPAVFAHQHHIELTTIFRQTDAKYCEILNEIRRGRISQESKRQLQARVGVKYEDEMTEKSGGIVPTKLFPIRSKVDFINTTMFSHIKEPENVFEYVRQTNCIAYNESGKPIPAEILVECAQLTKEVLDAEIATLVNSSQCVQILRLKKGAIVMCTSNIDMENGIFNGAQGIVVDFTAVGGHPVVRFRNGVVKQMEIHNIQHEEYPTIMIGQYPLVLSWAMTIHKIQGATLPKAEIDIGASIFECGQTYVALSRVQTLDGLYLTSFDPSKIRINARVIEFYNGLPKIDYIEVLESPTQTRACSLEEGTTEGTTEGTKEIKELNFDEFAYQVPSNTPETTTRRIRL